MNKPIVIKPKSTNFGTGISIFSEGTDKESIIKAFEIAFKYDCTVILQYQGSKETVIDEEINELLMLLFVAKFLDQKCQLIIFLTG